MASRQSAVTKDDFARPRTTVDVLIFTVLDDALKVLLVRRPSSNRPPMAIA